MSILIVSDDAEAADSLRSALARLGQSPVWESTLFRARERVQEAPPLVLVADNALDGYEALIDDLREEAPWTRVYVMADPSVSATDDAVYSVAKPFDASELAALISREQQLAELELGRRNLQAHVDELALLVEASFEAIVGLGRDGKIRSWNNGAAAIYGYEAQEIIGRDIAVLDVETEQAHERLRSSSRQACEVRRRRKDGREILVLLSLSKVESSSPTTFGFAEVSLDITERRKLERELEHAERLAAIGRIAASMAHEINNPLAVIHASTEYLAEIAKAAQDPDLTECTRDIALAIERISSFVQHVCGFARRERPILSDTSLSQAIDIAWRMVRPRATQRGVQLRVEKPGDPFVPHDPPRLAQAILNLLSNAVDAAASGGKHVVLRVSEESGVVRVQVDDDGPGVAKEIAQNLFEPFATTKPPGQGTGLGLAITRQILGDHHGTVSLLALPEGGTRAELVLPSFDPKSQQILVLDSDPSLRRALSADLRREHFAVLTAGTLGEARELLKTQRVSVIVAEHRLPDAEEPALFAELRRAAPNAPCIVVTGDPDVREVKGAHALFAKPWDRVRLVSTVRQACIAAERS